MKKYEKEIVRSINMGNSIGVQEFSAYIDSFGSDILETLYGYINERLDRYVGEADIDNLDIAFEYLERVLLNTEYDRKLSKYRIRKLNQKIYRIGVERKKKFSIPPLVIYILISIFLVVGCYLIISKLY